jgi:ribosomal subunit interface protein
MKLPVQITVRDVDASEAVESRIREKAADLERFHPGIMSCRVVVERGARHKHQGKPFVVKLDIGVPGSEIVVNRDEHEDVYVALRDAFDAAKRQLEEHARRQRGD